MLTIKIRETNGLKAMWVALPSVVDGVVGDAVDGVAVDGVVGDGVVGDAVGPVVSSFFSQGPMVLS